MNKETKLQWTIRNFHYWCGKLDIPHPIKFTRDNRESGIFTTNLFEDNSLHVTYNYKEIRKRPKCRILLDILHEIGHLKHGIKNESRKQTILSERKAEKFAFKILKRYCPKNYNMAVKLNRKNKTIDNYKKIDMLYYEAFKTIEEYKI